MHTDRHQPAPQTLLAVRGLSFGYETRPLCEDLNFTLEAGCWRAITGPNGAGKTTLLRTLCGLSEALGGTILFHNQECAGRLPESIYIGHRTGLKAELSVRENLSFYAALSGASNGAVSGAAEQMGLTGVLDKPCAKLSQGQQRRAALCRLLVEKQRLWLLDEPLAGLDDHSIACLLQMIADHLANGGCALIATHRKLEVPGRAASGEMRLSPPAPHNTDE